MYKADTLDAMAAKLGMNAAVLKATVDAFSREIGRASCRERV